MLSAVGSLSQEMPQSFSHGFILAGVGSKTAILRVISRKRRFAVHALERVLGADAQPCEMAGAACMVA